MNEYLIKYNKFLGEIEIDCNRLYCPLYVTVGKLDNGRWTPFMFFFGY